MLVLPVSHSHFLSTLPFYLSFLLNPFLDRKNRPPLRLLLLGVDNAGKTSMLARLGGRSGEITQPTVGFNFALGKYIYITVLPDTYLFTDMLLLFISWSHQSQPLPFVISYSFIIISYFSFHVSLTPSFPFPFPFILLCPPCLPSICPYLSTYLPTYLSLVTWNTIRFSLWDIGGSPDNRVLWRNYYHGTDVLLFMIDAADNNKINIAKVM